MDATLNKPMAALPVERSPGYWSTVGRRLLRNRLAMLAALILLALIVMAIFAPALMPADPMPPRFSSASSRSASRAIRSAPTNWDATCCRG